MTCRAFADFLLAYRAGELPGPARAAFEAHLAHCEDCVRYLGSYDATVALARVAARDPDAPVPADVPEALVRAVLAARQRS